MTGYVQTSDGVHAWIVFEEVHECWRVARQILPFDFQDGTYIDYDEATQEFSLTPVPVVTQEDWDAGREWADKVMGNVSG